MTQRGIYNNRSQLNNFQGQGLNDILKIFGLDKQLSHEYTGENHAKGYNFLGPGTNLIQRRKANDMTPINTLDGAAKNHDLAYEKVNKKLKDKVISREEAIEEIHDYDEEFIQELGKIPGFSMNKIIAEKAILLKRWLESKKLLSPDTFSISGSGMVGNDYDFSGNGILLAGEMMKKEYFKPTHMLTKKMDYAKSKRKMDGGFLPAILPFLLPVIGSLVADLGVTGIKKLVGHFGSKKGEGMRDIIMKMDEMSNDDQINKLHDFIFNKRK